MANPEHVDTSSASSGLSAAPVAHGAWMQVALDEARAALEHGDVPVGAVVVRDGEVLAARHNERELTGDPTAHAEILALRDAAAAIGHWRLDDCTLVVTLEPCAMCAGAMVNAPARTPRRTVPPIPRLVPPAAVSTCSTGPC